MKQRTYRLDLRVPLVVLVLQSSFITQAKSVSGEFRICETENISSELVGGEGVILSPTNKQMTPLNCTLTLTGVPTNSWFELSVSTLRLPQNGESNYILVNGDKSITNSVQTPIVFVTNNSINISLYAEDFGTDHQFNLSYRVASVVDMMDRTGEENQIVNTGGRADGYIVSHSTYSISNYRSYTNSRLTLANLKTDNISLCFQFLELEVRYSGYCYDYLEISTGDTLSTICGKDKQKYLSSCLNLRIVDQQLSFHFRTDVNGNREGFLISYHVFQNVSDGETEGEEVVVGDGIGVEAESTVDIKLINSTTEIRGDGRTFPDTTSTASVIDISLVAEYTDVTLTPHQTDMEDKESGSWLYIGIGITGGVVVLVMVILAAWEILRDKHKPTKLCCTRCYSQDSMMKSNVKDVPKQESGQELNSEDAGCRESMDCYSRVASNGYPNCALPDDSNGMVVERKSSQYLVPDSPAGDCNSNNSIAGSFTSVYVDKCWVVEGETA